MAINMSSRDSSPRISFSHNLIPENPTQTSPKQDTRLDQSLLLQSSSDFNFCITSFETETQTSPADELFFNGIIIPTQIKPKINIITNAEITSLTKSTLVREEKIEISNSKSFWMFKRSCSLNCEKQRSSIWSNFPLLLRSKSTGSSLIGNKSNPKKQIQNNSTKMGSNLPPQYQKSSSGKNGRNYSSVLNVPNPYIAKGTSDLMGFKSLFRNGTKEKKTKK